MRIRDLALAALAAFTASAVHPADGPDPSSRCAVVEGEGAVPRPNAACDAFIAAAPNPAEQAARMFRVAYLLNEVRNGAAAAASLLVKATALTPGRAQIWHELAYTQGELGEYAAALVSIERALALRPNDGEDLRERAHIRRMLGDFAGSAADYEQVIERGGSSVALLSALADAQIWLGDFAEARTTLERMGAGTEANAERARLLSTIDRQERARSADGAACRTPTKPVDQAGAAALVDACTAAYLTASDGGGRAAALTVRAAARAIEERRADAGSGDLQVAYALAKAASGKK